MGQLKRGNGTVIDGGRVIMHGQWNTGLCSSLVDSAQPHDIRIHKNCLSGFRGKMVVEKALHALGIGMLGFSGENMDQCVLSICTMYELRRADIYVK